MEGIAQVAKQQQTQVAAQDVQTRAVEQNQQVRSQQNESLIKQAQDSTLDSNKKLNSKEDVQELVKQLNKALEPISTDVKFGVDAQDVFYVSVIDTRTDRMIRRFPAEKAQEVLPKMQEVSGILFDHKG